MWNMAIPTAAQNIMPKIVTTSPKPPTVQPLISSTTFVALPLATEVLFAVFYGVMAAAAAISGNFSTEKAWDLFVKIVSKPLVDLYNEIIKALSGKP